MTTAARIVAAGSALALLAVASRAQDSDAPDPRDLVNCVNLQQIDHTEVIDETTILFFMKTNDIYRNTLPIRCPGLDRDETFMYRTTLSQLCDVDVITVLTRLGAEFLPGASCGLGKFQPISEAAVEEIKAAAERGGEREN